MRRADDPPRGPGSVDPDQPTASEPAPSPERAFSGDAVESTLPGGKPGDRPIAWKRNLYAIVAAQTLAIVGFSLRVPFLPFYLEDLGVSTVEGQALWSGLVNAAGAGVMAISAPIWGVVADRRGRRPMLMRATFAATITVGLMSLATAPWHLLGLRLIEGALSGTVTAATALVATNTPKARLGYGLGLVQTAVFSGAFLGPLIGGVLADQIGPRLTFAVASGCLATAGLIVLFVVRERFEPAPRPAPRPPGVGRFASWRAASSYLLAPALLAMVAVMLVVRLTASAVQPIAPLFVEQLAPDTADPSTLAGIVLGVLGLTSAISAVVLGRLGDRRGYGKILFPCALGAGLLYLPMAAAQTPWHLIVAQALFGIAAGGLIPSANAIIANLTPSERRGAVYGVTAAAAAIGGFVGPLAGAGLAAAYGFRATFLATAVLLLALAAGIALTGIRGQVSDGRSEVR